MDRLQSDSPSPYSSTKGSVLEPSLFILYVIDLETEQIFSIMKYVNDTKMVGNALTQADSEGIQFDN